MYVTASARSSNVEKQFRGRTIYIYNPIGHTMNDTMNE